MTSPDLPTERADEMRALFVTNDFPPDVGGIERFTFNLASNITGAAVLAPAHPDAPAHDAALDFPVFRAPTTFMFPTSGTATVLHDAVRSHRPDVVVFLSPLPLPVLGPSLDVPWVVVAHGAELTIPARMPGLAQVTRHRLASAHGLFAVSKHTADRLLEFMNGQGPPVRIVRNGVALDTFSPALDPTVVRRRLGLGNDPVLACVGRLVPRKGQDRLIDAMPMILDQVPDARLLIVGDGRLRGKLERAADRLPQGAVVLTGAVPAEELALHFAAADVFAHPNRDRWFGLEQEGFGIIFLEAQACGKPVIAGRSGGAPEALRDGETGLAVDGSDTEAIAEAAVRLLSDEELAVRMGRAGRDFVETEYAWNRVVMDFTCHLRTIVDEVQRQST